MYGNKNKTNLIDNSITFLNEIIPIRMKTISLLFLKYLKIIHEQFKINSSFKSGILKDDIINLIQVPFTKQLLAANRDEFLNLHLDIEHLESFLNTCAESSDSIVSFNDYYDCCDKEGNILGEIGQIYINNINFKHLKTPYLQLLKFFNNDYSIKNKIIPLIIKPYINFDTYDKNKTKTVFEDDPIKDFLYDWEKFTTAKDIDVYGVGIKNTKIGCELTIDIESIFTLFMSFITNYSFLYKLGLGNIPYQYDKNISGNENEFNRYMIIIEKILELDNDIINKYFIDEYVINCLSNRIIYSASCTFLALVTRTQDSIRDFISECSASILDVTHEKLNNKAFYHEESDIDPNKGTLMRYMVSNIGALMQTLLHMKNSVPMGYNSWNKDDNIYTLIKDLINSVYTLKYQISNYIKVPSKDNKKYDQLINILNLSKLSTFYLSPKNKLNLSTIYDITETKLNGLGSLFVTYDGILIDSTYTRYSKLYTCIKSLLNYLCFYIISRYRSVKLVNDVEIETKPVDELRMNKSEYHQNCKDILHIVKNNIKQLAQIIYQYTGYSDETNTIVELGYHCNTNDINYKRCALSQIIYGICNETLFSDTSLKDRLLNTFDKQLGSDEDIKSDYKYVSPSIVLKSLHKIVKFNKEHEKNGEMKTVNNDIYCWYRLLSSRTKLIATELLEIYQNDFSKILEITEDYNDDKISTAHISIDDNFASNARANPDTNLGSIMTGTMKYEARSFNNCSYEDFNKVFKLIKGQEIAEGLVAPPGAVSGGGATPFSSFGDYQFTIGVTNKEEEINDTKDYIIPGTEDFKKLLLLTDKYLVNKY
jgi:hypothetical protein